MAATKFRATKAREMDVPSSAILQLDRPRSISSALSNATRGVSFPQSPLQLRAANEATSIAVRIARSNRRTRHVNSMVNSRTTCPLVNDAPTGFQNEKYARWQPRGQGRTTRNGCWHTPCRRLDSQYRRGRVKRRVCNALDCPFKRWDVLPSLLLPCLNVQARCMGFFTPWTSPSCMQPWEESRETEFHIEGMVDVFNGECWSRSDAQQHATLDV
eukprot:scaffold1401_cov330-Pavlova_lutheri.AAC.85